MIVHPHILQAAMKYWLVSNWEQASMIQVEQSQECHLLGKALILSNS
jgi:hypothetical protein